MLTNENECVSFRCKVREWLKKHPRIRCIQRVVRLSGNKEYVKKVINVDRGGDPILHPHWYDPHCVYIEKLGKRNPHRMIYVFKETEAIGGFFAEHRRTLLGLYYADRLNMTPVVYYGDDYRYHEDEPVNGATNGFEYYFKQTSDVSYEEALVSQNVVFFAPCHLKIDDSVEFSFYQPSMEELRISAEMQKKYICLRPELEKKIMGDINTLLKGKKTIGIHVRGTDFRLGLKNHPIPVDVVQHLENVRYAFEKCGFEQAFIATDEEKTILAAKEMFGDRVVFYNDVFRSNEETAAQYMEVDRRLHKYRMGVEVLRDMMTLAMCDALTAGLSQVSICARITKMSWGQDYEFYRVINNGLFQETSAKAKHVIKQYISDGRIPTKIN